MSKLLEQALLELSKLPEAQQDTMAQWILDELESEARWQATFANSLPQLEQLAQKALADNAAGRTYTLDVDSLDEIAD